MKNGEYVAFHPGLARMAKAMSFYGHLDLGQEHIDELNR